MLGQQSVELFLQVEDFLGVDFNIRRLSLETTQRLMNHDARVGQHEALALGAGGEQEGAHAGGLADAQGGHVRLDETHGVVNRHACGNRTARRIDIQVDVLVRILRFQEQQLRHNQIRGHVVHRPDHKHHPLFQQTRVDIVGTFAATALFHDHGDIPQAGRLLRPVIHQAFPIKASRVVGSSLT